METPLSFYRGGSANLILRFALFAYLTLVMCPLQYFAIVPEDIDNTWIFGLNYAAAHHMVVGRDFIWTSGPLAYLSSPMDIGSNLAQGLSFQLAVWLLVLVILWDVIFRPGPSLRNTVLLSIFLGLSANLYRVFPNPFGIADLLLVSALILLLRFKSQGGMVRYLTALLMLGIVPLIQIVGAMSVIGVIFGLVVYELVHPSPGRWRRILLAVAVPSIIAATGLSLTLGSFETLALYLKGSSEISNGYNWGMSLRGSPVEFIAAFESLVLLGIALAFLRAQNRILWHFLALVLPLPLLVNFKHAFVRHDSHIAYFFCFIAAALGLAVLVTSLQEKRTAVVFAAITIMFTVIWQDNVARTGWPAALSPTGTRTLPPLWHTLRADIRRKLDSELQKIPPDLKLEPAIRELIKNDRVAYLSDRYSAAWADHVNLALYPVIQRDQVYTPYLDQWNADWVREKGPRFLIYDPDADIRVRNPFSDFLKDIRHPWVESPAMWVEIYRWYNLRLIGTHNLLLERRSEPRFTHFASLGRRRIGFQDELRFPSSPSPVFWTMRCPLTRAGQLEALILHVLPVTITVVEHGGKAFTLRAVPQVLEAPSMGTYLPTTSAEFAEVLKDGENPNFIIETLRLGGPGASAYSPSCEVELLHPEH